MIIVQKAGLEAAVAALPEVLRGNVARWFDELAHQYPDWLSSQLDIGLLARLVASSEFAARMLIKEWEWFAEEFARGKLECEPEIQEVSSRLEGLVADTGDEKSLKRTLRIVRNRVLLHVLWRITAQRCNSQSLAETLQSLSDLADLLVSYSVRIATTMLEPRFGVPVDDEQIPIPFVVLAMGKLGGRELNFSSDIDLIFLYPENGSTDGKRVLDGHEYFTRLSRRVVALLDETTEDGFVFRVDLRLRPFGTSGPPVASFAGLEAYLIKHGRSWERYAYVKARAITPATDAPAVKELVTSTINPFVYRRYLDFGVFASLRDMKSRISLEVQRRELADNIKLGPGGIREIEFIVQSLQLVRGGSDESLRSQQIQIVLPRLEQGKGLDADAVHKLLTAYNFLRRLENAIQALHDQQTHDLPADETNKARLLVALDYEDWTVLTSDIDQQRANVSELFAAVAFRVSDESTPSELYRSLATHWESGSSSTRWRQLLADNDYKEPDKLAKIIESFAQRLESEKISATATKRVQRFIPALLGLLQELPAPETVAERVLSIASRILRRSAYLALLNENPATLLRLVSLCEQSAYLAEEIANFPLLLDELLDPRLHSTRISRAVMEEDLGQRFAAAGKAADSEQKIEILAQFQRANLFRIAVADFNDDLPIMKVSDRLTDLAEIVLLHALELAWADMIAKHGVPRTQGPDGETTAGLGVIAYGKLAGMELSYRSDLDLVFLHDSGEISPPTDGAKPLDNSVFFIRLARRLVHFLTIQTGSGALYDVDTRLRPSGRAGLLVVNLDSFEQYQKQHAWTWEHQALLRSRPVAGSERVAREFERIRATTLRNRVNRRQLLDDVVAMKSKMRRNLDRSTTRKFDIKDGEGGIGDLEFLVQYLVLKNAHNTPAIIHYPDNIRQLGALGATGLLPQSVVMQLQRAYRAYRLRLHRMTLDGDKPIVDGKEFAEERDLVRTAWQRFMN